LVINHFLLINIFSVISFYVRFWFELLISIIYFVVFFLFAVVVTDYNICKIILITNRIFTLGIVLWWRITLMIRTLKNLIGHQIHWRLPARIINCGLTLYIPRSIELFEILRKPLYQKIWITDYAEGTNWLVSDFIFFFDLYLAWWHCLRG